MALHTGNSVMGRFEEKMQLQSNDEKKIYFFIFFLFVYYNITTNYILIIYELSHFDYVIDVAS